MEKLGVFSPILNTFLEAKNTDHEQDFKESRQSGAEDKDPPVEIAVPDVQCKVGKGDGGRRVRHDRDQAHRRRPEHGQAGHESQQLDDEKSNRNTEAGRQLHIFAFVVELCVVNREAGSDIFVP